MDRAEPQHAAPPVPGQVPLRILVVFGFDHHQHNCPGVDSKTPSPGIPSGARAGGGRASASDAEPATR